MKTFGYQVFRMSPAIGWYVNSETGEHWVDVTWPMPGGKELRHRSHTSVRRAMTAMYRHLDRLGIDYLGRTIEANEGPP